MSIGKIAFLAGVVIAILAAFITFSWVPLALLIIGLIVGFMNVSGSESQGFLIAGIALLLSVSSAAGLPHIGGIITTVLSNIVAFVAPAMLVVAVKSLLSTAAD